MPSPLSIMPPPLSILRFFLPALFPYHITSSASLHTTASTMSATLSALITLENARSADGSPASVLFDGQIWLAPDCVLTGIFNFYNSTNMTFSEIEHFFACIHVRSSSQSSSLRTYTIQVAKFLPSSVSENTKENTTHSFKTPNEEGSQNSEGLASSSTLDDTDLVHVAGDIVHVRLTI